MKERLLGDFSRKNLNLDNIFDKVLDSEELIAKNFSIPRRFSRRVLDSEKITSISIGTVALVVSCLHLFTDDRAPLFYPYRVITRWLKLNKTYVLRQERSP